MTKTTRTRKPTSRFGADLTQDINYLLTAMVEQTHGVIWVFWPSRQPGKTLETMLESGLVTMVEEKMDNRRSKRTYTITEEGKARHYRRRPKLEPAT